MKYRGIPLIFSGNFNAISHFVEKVCDVEAQKEPPVYACMDDDSYLDSMKHGGIDSPLTIPLEDCYPFTHDDTLQQTHRELHIHPRKHSLSIDMERWLVPTLILQPTDY